MLRKAFEYLIQTSDANAHTIQKEIFVGNLTDAFTARENVAYEEFASFGQREIVVDFDEFHFGETF
jgi:hypothetical protein